MQTRNVFRRVASTFVGLVLASSLLPPSAGAVEHTSARPYIVTLEMPSLAEALMHPRRAVGASTRALWTSLSRSRGAVRYAARAVGAEITFDYGRLISGFGARMTHAEAAEVAALPGVDSVLPAGIVSMYEGGAQAPSSSLRTNKTARSGGRGLKIAIIDSGIDYTHAAFGGEGTRAAYERNDPDVVEPGTFPTSKVIGGYDFVGDNYAVSDDSTTNDIPKPDPDPLDTNGHGTHVAGICCGKPTSELEPGVAPRVKILSYKVWDEGDSTADVLVAAFERAVDPNGDGSFDDRPDVINFSGGVNFGSPEAAESLAAQRAVDLGIVVVAAAGNAGNEMSGGAAYRVGAPATAPGVIAVAAHDERPRVARFSSEGPSRGGAHLKPDIAASGVGISAAAAGDGAGAAILSGTSMAAPQVAGAAVLMRAQRPRWSPDRIKSALMNNAAPGLKGPSGRPAPAAVRGAGKMRLERSKRAKMLAWPGSISFGRSFETETETFLSSPLRLKNLGRFRQIYSVTAEFGATQVGESPFEVRIVGDEGPVVAEVFTLPPRSARSIQLQLTFTPSLVDPADRLRAWYGGHPDTDGAVVITSHKGKTKKKIRVPWHIVPVASHAMSASSEPLTLRPEDTGTISVNSSGSGEHGDAYVLGAPDAVDSGGEEDITHIAARSFAGASADGDLPALPDGFDPLRGFTWAGFLSDIHEVTQPVEFLIRTESPRYTTETLDATVLIDAGGDGVYANDELQADFTLALTDDGSSCLVDLSVSARRCSAVYSSDYAFYDTNLLGLVLDAADLGMADGEGEITYRAEVCTDLFSGDVPQPRCDEAGAVPGAANAAALDIFAPALAIDPLVCGGPWDGAPCADGFTVRKSSPADKAEVLLIFPGAPPQENFVRIPVQ